LKLHLEKLHPNGFDSGARADPITNKYKCQNCQEMFVQMKRYDRHMLTCRIASTGTEEFAAKDFHCNKCNTFLPSVEALRLHIKHEHCDEQFCEICGKKLKNPQSLRKHMARVHKGN
jgi:hypothetical protein